MAQGLPIQPPQVEEVQGGMRLTPLGLAQLAGDANAVGTPMGVVPALADPGTGATTTAAARAPGVVTQYVIDVPNTANSITTHYATPVGLVGVAAGFLVTGVRFIKQGGAGHGSGANTIQLRNNSTSGSNITEAVSYVSGGSPDVGVDGLNRVAGIVDDANAFVLAGTGLVLTLIKNAGGNSAHRVIVDGLLITQ